MTSTSEGDQMLGKLLQYHVSRDWMEQTDIKQPPKWSIKKGTIALLWYYCPKMQNLYLNMKKHDKPKLWTNQQNNPAMLLKASRLQKTKN